MVVRRRGVVAVASNCRCARAPVELHDVLASWQAAVEGVAMAGAHEEEQQASPQEGDKDGRAQCEP